MTPKELADRNAERFKALLPRINATNDFFIRTSDPRHKRAVQEVMQRIHDNGHTYKGMYEGWYCPRCADFKTENEVGPEQTCPIHKIPLDREREENWFFRLSSFQEPLERLYTEKPGFVQPRVRYNEALDKEASKLLLMQDEGAPDKNYYVNSDFNRLQMNAPWYGPEFHRMCTNIEWDDLEIS